MSERDESNQKFIVLINDEEQYSLWPHLKEIPAGWRKVRDAATREECAEFVDSVWTDMRPLSLRKAMEST